MTGCSRFAQSGLNLPEIMACAMNNVFIKFARFSLCLFLPRSARRTSVLAREPVRGHDWWMQLRRTAAERTSAAAGGRQLTSTRPAGHCDGPRHGRADAACEPGDEQAPQQLQVASEPASSVP